MPPIAEPHDYARKLDERAEKLRAALRAQPGFSDMIRDAQLAEANGEFLTLDEVREQFEIAD